ncbi:MAG: glycosyltransferase family 2 protein [Brevinemataceae bacterium]
MLSIIIPIYNKAHYLPRCLQSILKYKNQPLEVLCIDDCSSDNSIALIEEYRKKDSRVRLIQNKENMGTFLTRANGIRQAEGDYIFCVDPDDYINSECFDLAKEFMGKTDIIVFNTDFVMKDYSVFFGNTGDESLLGSNIFQAYASTRLENWGMSPKLIKREIALKALDELDIHKHLIINEDLLLYLPCTILSSSFQRIDIIAYYYMNHDEDSATRSAVTFNKLDKDFHDLEITLTNLQSFFHKYNYDYDSYGKIYQNLFLFFHDKILNSSLSENDKKVASRKLADIIGGKTIYETFFVNDKYLRYINKLVKKVFHLTEKIVPTGTIHRSLLKIILGFCFNIVRACYRKTYSLYTLIQKKINKNKFT